MPHGPKIKSKKKAGERYPVEFQAAAILAVRANGGNCSRTAVELGVPVRTVQMWVSRGRCSAASIVAGIYKGDLEKAFEALAWDAIARAHAMAPGASYRDLMRGAGLAFDKMRVIQGLPSDNIQTTNVNVNFDAKALTAAERAMLASLLRKGDPGESGTDRRPKGDTAGTGAGGLPSIPHPELPDAGTEPGGPV